MSRLVLAVASLLLAAGCAARDGFHAEPPPPSRDSATPIAPVTPTPSPIRTQAAHPELRKELLAMLAADQADRRKAATAGEADPGELAYLTDRVAANAGQPQTYGTQMGCGTDGKPQLAPLAEPDRVDELRAEAGLPTLEAYLAELAEVCAQSQ
jgi:hypothetical protein